MRCDLALQMLNRFADKSTFTVGWDGTKKVSVTNEQPLFGLRGWRVEIGSDVCYIWRRTAEWPRKYNKAATERMVKAITST